MARVIGNLIIVYLKYVTKIIEEERVNYALPVYNIAHITANNSNIDLTISYDLILETLLMGIRGETIKFASHLKKKRDIQEKKTN